MTNIRTPRLQTVACSPRYSPTSSHSGGAYRCVPCRDNYSQTCIALLSFLIITSNSRNIPGSKCVPEPKSMRMQLLVLRLTRIFSSFMSRCSTFLFLRVFTADNIYQKYFITHFRTRQKLLSNYDQTCLKNFWAVASSSDPFSVMKSNKSWKKKLIENMCKNIYDKICVTL